MLNNYVLPLLVNHATFGVGVYLLSKFLIKKPSYHLVVIVPVIIVASIILFFLNTLHIAWVNTISGYIIFTIIAHLLFKGNFASKLGFSVTVVTLGAVGELLLTCCPLIISKLHLNAMISNSYFYNIMGFGGVIIIFAFGRIIAYKFPRKYESLQLRDMFLISFQIFATAALLAIVHFIGELHLSFVANILIVLLQFSMLASSVLVFFIFDSAFHKRELETQIEYYKYQFEQIKASQTVFGRIDHDIEKHLLALKLDLKNAKPDEAEQKIDLLIGNLHIAEGVANSGNADVDAILNYKANLAKAYGIRMACDLLLPYTLNMNTTDLTVILGNALDNAIEACKEVDAPDRVIDLAIRYDKPNLHMTFANPFMGKISTDAAGELVTTKWDNLHGFGLKSIKETVEKYDGVMDIAAENNRFTLKILLFDLTRSNR
jgi:hypothetical protein